MFKVGDWVREYDKYSDNVNVVQIDEHLLFDIENGRVYDTYELWEPQKGEWCWFWDNTTKIPYLNQFMKMDRGLYQPKDSVMGFQYCEPFIGNLPSKYKGK